MKLEEIEAFVEKVKGMSDEELDYWLRQLMDEETFANVQHDAPMVDCGDIRQFTKNSQSFFLALHKVLPEYDPNTGKVHVLDDGILMERICNGGYSLPEYRIVVLSFLFGAYGCPKRVDIADALARNLWNAAKNREMFAEVVGILEWREWYATAALLFGTVYAMDHDYVKASYYFLQTLKTGRLILDHPYSDFVFYILGKLDDLPKKEYLGKGRGFSAKLPMGPASGEVLIAHRALEIISEMEGENGEEIVAKQAKCPRQGRIHFYGHLVRLGSIRNESGEGVMPIDIYETYLIDSKFDLYRIKFWFQGYFPRNGGWRIRLANGFRFVSEGGTMHWVADEN